MKKLALILSVLIATTLTSCASSKVIADDLTAAQIIQLGQNALDLTNYKNAEECFTTVIKRYGTNLSIYIEAKYELGHLYIKTKSYDKAYAAFTEILEYYDGSFVSDIPPEFKKLSQIGISQIPEKKLESLQKASLVEAE